MSKFICFVMSILMLLQVCIIVKPAEQTYADGFNGSTFLYTEKETVSYSSKKESEVSISGGLPKYYSTFSNTNDCAPVAGSIVLGYFDRQFDQLIPNFTAGRYIRDQFIYIAQNDTIVNLTNTLYDLMDTNTSGNGTTVNQFKNGLQEYVQSRGRTIGYSSVMKGSLSVQEVIDSINLGNPVVIFVVGYALVSDDDISSTTNTDTYAKDIYGGAHTMVVGGVKTITYYNQSGIEIGGKILLNVSSGYRENGNRYMILNDYGNLDDAYSVKIN